MQINIETSWREMLQMEFGKLYFKNLSRAVHEECVSKSKVIYPTAENIFNAFSLCPFDQVRVVILGQDPYHGDGQAHGLSFSVPHGVKIPPSLKNVYKEIKADIGGVISESGNLEHWATQGVLLLNATLTVEAGKPGSHQGLGWETFTDAVIKTISDKKVHIVFMLWGNFARSKALLIDKSKHLVLEAPHPSPFSAYTGFFGCRHFSKTNDYLKENGFLGIEW